MAELKILGEKRVKALLTVLDAKEKEARAAIAIPSAEDVVRTVDAEFGIAEKRARAAELIEEANAVLKEINAVTGEGAYVSKNSSYRLENGGQEAYRKRKDELTASLRTKPLDELTAKFNAKRTELWLCETLEQAKAIVGIS